MTDHGMKEILAVFCYWTNAKTNGRQCLKVHFTEKRLTKKQLF